MSVKDVKPKKKKKESQNLRKKEQKSGCQKVEDGTNGEKLTKGYKLSTTRLMSCENLM